MGKATHEPTSPEQTVANVIRLLVEGPSDETVVGAFLRAAGYPEERVLSRTAAHQGAIWWGYTGGAQPAGASISLAAGIGVRAR